MDFLRSSQWPPPHPRRHAVEGGKPKALYSTAQSVRVVNPVGAILNRSSAIGLSDAGLEDLAGIDFGAEVGDELVERARAQVAFRAVANGDGAGFGFLAADDQHVGNFFELGVANFGLQLFVAVVQMRTEARSFQFLRHLLRVVDEFSAYGQHGSLHWSQPDRKSPRVVLNQDSEESLDRAEQRAMHHQGLVARTVFAHVFELESRRQIEIELYGG